MIHQKEASYDGIKIINKLPEYIAEFVLRKKYLISNLKVYLTDKAFYSTEEYMNS